MLDWALELGPCKGSTSVLVCSRNSTQPKLVESALECARMVFGTASVIHPLGQIPDETWPKGPNWLFHTASEHVQKEKLGPWLWLEPDAIPLCSGWMDHISKAYAQRAALFMGPLLDPKGKYRGMAGVGVYPEKCWEMFQAHATNPSTAFDVAYGHVTSQHMAVTPLITHFWGKQDLPPTFVAERAATNPINALTLASIPKLSVLFHRSKDGTLIDLLRGKVCTVTKEDVAKDITVVITSYQRPELLRKAFDSCIAAGVRNIVVAATGDMTAMHPVFTAIGGRAIILQDKKATSNQSWLHGVESAKTKYVTILHDDDLLLPEYLDVIAPGLASAAPFVMVQARNHGVPDYIEKDSDQTGLVPTSILHHRLSRKGGLAISPLRGVFQKPDLVQWLQHCEAMPQSCYLRPGFLVGNDLAIWLKATKKYRFFYNVPIPAVSFGHWEGSTTVSELGKGDGKLARIYDETRKWLSTSKQMPLHILTIVLDGMPFITQHLSVFNRLKIPWTWHIVEGAASNTHCTKWCKPQTGRLSNDGTKEYLDQIAIHPRVHLYRKELWDGKVSMVNAPLKDIKEECVLLEVDCDEFWTSDQLLSIVKIFHTNPSSTHAMFWCRYFFGPHLVMEGRNCYGNSPSQDWKRAWRFKPGDTFIRHEPPILSSEQQAIPHLITEANGLVFDHYGYAQRSQVKFKEGFYGYKDAVKHWERLQQVKTGEVKLSDYLPWVNSQHSGTVKVIS